MTVTDLVWIAIGELLLAATFALGVCVGVALKRKESHDDNGNERASIVEKNGWWHLADGGRTQTGAACRGPGGRCSQRQAGLGERPPQR